MASPSQSSSAGKTPWDGVVMVYTPETLDELDITIQIIVDAYNIITGASLNPSDIA